MSSTQFETRVKLCFQNGAASHNLCVVVSATGAAQDGRVACLASGGRAAGQSVTSVS